MQANKDKSEQYTQALIALARANNCLDAINDDLLHLLDFIQENGAIRQFLAAPTVTAPGKQSALGEMLDNRIHPILVQFLMLLIAANDVLLLPAIATKFAEENRQTTYGEIQSAIPLSADRIAAIEEAVSNRINHKISLRNRVMNNILGGILVRVGDYMLDGTLDTQLEKAHQQLLSGPTF